ncbi:hypothetical protein ACKWTF_016628 [Chironomus riparius]
MEIDNERRSQSSCDLDKSSSAYHKRKHSSNSISNKSDSSGKNYNHSINNGRKRRRVSCNSQNNDDDDILKLDPIENCVSPYANGSVNNHSNGQNHKTFSNNNNHNNLNNNQKNNNFNSNNFNNNYKNFNNNNNRNNNNNNNNNNRNNNNNNSNLNNNSNNNKSNWYHKNQRYNKGNVKNNNNNNNNNNKKPFIPFQQRINELEERLNQKELQLKESRIDVMNRESDITELRIQHERDFLEIEKNHCRKIKEIQLKEINLIQIHKDEAMKLRLALENKRDIIAKLRKELQDAQNDILVTRAILETTNNRNVELTGRIADLLDTKKKNMSNKRIQTDQNGVNVETQVDDFDIEMKLKIFHMSPPQSIVVHSTTKHDPLPDIKSDDPRDFIYNDKYVRNDSLDSGVSIDRSESLQSQLSIENGHNDPSDALKFHFLSTNSTQKDKQNELLKLIYKKKLPKNKVNQNLTINIDGTKSDDYVMVDYIESPDEMPGKNLSSENLDISRDYFVDQLKDSKDQEVYESANLVERLNYKQNNQESVNLQNNIRVFSKRLKEGYEDSTEEVQESLINYGEILNEHVIDKSTDSIHSSSGNSIEENSIDKILQKAVIKSTEILNELKDKPQESCPESTKFTEQYSNEARFELLSSNLKESSKNLSKKLNFNKDAIESESNQDISTKISKTKESFKSPSKTYELSPKIYNIPPNIRDCRRSSSDLSKDLSNSIDNLSISSELQDFLNLSESEPNDEVQSNVPISEADFNEFAEKFKEKFKKNMIQKAARESLYIPIIPCYTNDIKKTKHSNESVNNFSDEKILLNNQNEQRIKSTDELKTANETDKNDNNNQELVDATRNDEESKLTTNSIKIENDANVSENDTDIDEYHNSVVRSLIKCESVEDSCSSISSQFSTSADDNTLRNENILNDKILTDKNVIDKDLRVAEIVETEVINSIGVADKSNELEKQSVNGGLSTDELKAISEHESMLISENPKECEDKSHDLVKADLQDLEETIKILEGDSATNHEVCQERSLNSESNIEISVDNIKESCEPSETLTQFEESVLDFSKKSEKTLIEVEKLISQNSINTSQSVAEPLKIFTNLISNDSNVASQTQNSPKVTQNSSKMIQIPTILQNSSITQPITKPQPYVHQNILKNTKKMQKIDDNCPSYLHSFQDFLTKSCIVFNPALNSVENVKSVQQIPSDDLDRNQQEQFKKEFQQKQRPKKIVKRRESILVDNFRVKRQKIETRSVDKKMQSDEVLKAAGKLRNIVENLNDLKIPELEIEKEKVPQNSSFVLHQQNIDETQSRNDLLCSIPRNVNQFPFQFNNNQIVSNFSSNESSFTPQTQTSNYQIFENQANVIRNHLGLIDYGSHLICTPYEGCKLISTDFQTNSVNNQQLVVPGQGCDKGLINNEKNNQSEVINGYADNYNQNISQASCISIENDANLHDSQYTQHEPSENVNKRCVINDLSKNVVDLKILSTTRHDSQIIKNDSVPASNENYSGRVNELRHSLSCSPVSSVESREYLRSLTPEYKGSPSSSSGNDFVMSPVESFEKQEASLTKKSSPFKNIKSPFKIDQKKSRNLPSEDEMGVCSQIVATTLKKSQQQREMSRSSEERMLQSGNFQGYSRNEQFYGYRNERVESGFVTSEGIDRNDKFDRHNVNNSLKFNGNRFNLRHDKNRRNSVHDSVHNRLNVSPNDKKFFERSGSLLSQDLLPKSSKYLRSNSYQEPQLKQNSRTPLTIPFKPIKEPSFTNDNPNIQHIKNIIPSPSLSPPSLIIDENNFKRAQNKNEISQLVIAELTVFYELKKFESDNPKELFKSMARAITYHFYDKNPDNVPNKNAIKNYVMEVFFNYGTIRSEKDFLLSENYGDDF